MLYILFLLHVTISKCLASHINYTEPKLAGSIFRLNCKENQSIIISQIEFAPIHANDTECIELYNIVLKKSHCNGASSCDYPLHESVGQSCNFKTRYARILYVCVPNGENVTNSMSNAYEFCRLNDTGRETLDLSYGDGFFLSPNFPNDYGDKRTCVFDVKLPNNSRLVSHSKLIRSRLLILISFIFCHFSSLIIYILKMNIEDKSKVNGKDILTDYLTISPMTPDENTHYGSKNYTIIYNSTHGTTLSFKTNFITMTHIPFPKGFILYYTTTLEIEKLQVSKASTTKSLEKIKNPNREAILATLINKELNEDTKQIVKSSFRMPDSTEQLEIALNSEKASKKAVNNGLSLLDQAIQNRRIILFVCTILALVALLGFLLMGILYMIKRRHEPSSLSSFNQNGNLFLNDASAFDLLKQLELAKLLTNSVYLKRNTRNQSQLSDFLFNEATLRLLENGKNNNGVNAVSNYLDDEYYLCPIEAKSSEETYEKLT